METAVVLACVVVQATPHAYEQMTLQGLAHCLSAFFPLSFVMKCSAWLGFVFAFFFLMHADPETTEARFFSPKSQTRVYMCLTGCGWSEYKHMQALIVMGWGFFFSLKNYL